MSKNIYYPKIKKEKAKKYVCTKCGKVLTSATAFYYVDANNCAINDNAKPYCKECYILKYGRY